MENSKFKNQKRLKAKWYGVSLNLYHLPFIPKLVIILLFAFCLLNFYGCATASKKDKVISGPLEPQVLSRFSDIPVPVGFKLLAQDSYTFESGGIRAGVLKYRGKANVEQVLNFYKDQMLMYNWNLLNVIEYGERLMNFERESETCIISLLPKGNAITLTISLGPKSQIPKKSNKPVK